MNTFIQTLSFSIFKVCNFNRIPDHFVSPQSAFSIIHVFQSLWFGSHCQLVSSSTSPHFIQSSCEPQQPAVVFIHTLFLSHFTISRLCPVYKNRQGWLLCVSFLAISTSISYMCYPFSLHTSHKLNVKYFASKFSTEYHIFSARQLLENFVKLWKTCIRLYSVTYSFQNRACVLF